MLQWVIFDCDGTLVDSEYLCNLGLEIKLRERGVIEDAHTLMSRYRGPEACAVVGDSLVGIEAALKAGMRPYLYDPQGIYRTVGREVTLFKDMRQLPELLMRKGVCDE